MPQALPLNHRQLPQIPSYLRKITESEKIDFVGITNADSYPDVSQKYQTWISNENHGQMEYLKKHAPFKTDPQKLLPNCKSIILIGLNYFQERPQPDENKNRGLIARYAWGRDYHKVIKRKLKRISQELKKRFPEEEFYYNTDATPLLERHYATKANLGYTGKNTMVISLPYGSFFLIGEILTTKKLESSPTIKQGSCGTCQRCINVCPTKALETPYKIDARKCISYLTIEHKGSIPENLRPLIGNWLFGCDLCQDVCPHNIRAKVTEEPDFKKSIAGSSRLLKEILDIKTDEQFVEKFAGSPLMRAKRIGLIRNACIVAANNNATKLLPKLKLLSTDPDPIISEHALWAYNQLASKQEAI